MNERRRERKAREHERKCVREREGERKERVDWTSILHAL